MKQLTIKQKMSLYTYELELLSEMKVHSTFYINLLRFSKNDSISRQMSLSQFTIIENEKDSYFVDSVDNMK